MRIASRIVGIVLALAGLAFLALPFVIVTGGFDRKSVLADSGPDRTAWIAGSICAILGVGFILAGTYFFRLDVDALDEAQKPPASRFAPYFAAHRRELKLIAQAGLVISLIRLGVACFGVDWPGRWATWPLFLMALGLAAVGKPFTADDLPLPLDSFVKGGGAAFLILVPLWAGSPYWHLQAGARISQAGIILLLFAREAITFAYGEIGTDEKRG